MAETSALSLDSVTRVRESGLVFSGPLANDLQKFMQFGNSLQRRVAALEAASSAVIPVSPSTLSDFTIPGPEFRDDGAMDVAIQALSLASWPPLTAVPQLFFCTQATFPALIQLPANTLIVVTDYAHQIFWDGTTPTFADNGSGWVAEGKPDGSAPTGGLWGRCNGNSYNVLQADGTLVSTLTEDRTNDSFPEGSTTFGAKAASRAKWETSAVTDDESTHIHSVDPPSTTSGNDSGAGTAVQSGAGTTVATHTHTHDTDIAPFNSGAGSAHHHALSDAKAQLKVPSESNGGLPARVGVSYWIRR